MEGITAFFENLGISLESAILLSFFLSFFALLLVYNRRAREEIARPALRSISAFAELDRYLAAAIEKGQAVHLSLGTQGIGAVATADTLAGLEVLERVADRLAGVGVPLIVSVADPTLFPVAQEILRRVYTRLGYGEGYDPRQVRLISPERAAYAAGAMGIISREKIGANILVGSFGEEFLLLGENGARRGIKQIGGTSSPQILPLVQVTMDEPLWGEEIYAGGAYLSAKPGHLASLRVQDWLRGAIILAVVLGVLALTVF
ncbi:MAG: hypothetical protein HYX86_04925 [Chloroflexi bacterium]|nr:hypothetical protein [Chloroflexota bacterium]